MTMERPQTTSAEPPERAERTLLWLLGTTPADERWAASVLMHLVRGLDRVAWHPPTGPELTMLMPFDPGDAVAEYGPPAVYAAGNYSDPRRPLGAEQAHPGDPAQLARWIRAGTLRHVVGAGAALGVPILFDSVSAMPGSMVDVVTVGPASDRSDTAEHYQTAAITPGTTLRAATSQLRIHTATGRRIALLGIDT